MLKYKAVIVDDENGQDRSYVVWENGKKIILS